MAQTFFFMIKLHNLGANSHTSMYFTGLLKINEFLYKIYSFTYLSKGKKIKFVPHAKF